MNAVPTARRCFTRARPRAEIQELRGGHSRATVRPSEAREKSANEFKGLTVCRTVGSFAYVCERGAISSSHTHARGVRPSDRHNYMPHVERDEEYQPFRSLRSHVGRPGQTVRPSGRIKNGGNNERVAPIFRGSSEQLCECSVLFLLPENGRENSISPQRGRGWARGHAIRTNISPQKEGA